MNYYQLLNIDNNSSTKEIKQHYYQLAKKYHPDKNNGSIQKSEEFKLLSEAYSILSNPKKRYIYDMKLIFQNNLGENFIDHFSDVELEIIHMYYQKLIKSTEFKFLKQLFQSLPKHCKTKLKQKFKQCSEKNTSLILSSSIKSINLKQLDENYIITLNRTLEDVYHNCCKEILVMTQSNYYHIFITHSDYTIHVYNSKRSHIKLNIETILPENYSLNGCDILYHFDINLYQYYFQEIFRISLPDNSILNLKNTSDFNCSIEYPNLGLKDIDNQRGKLYIYKNLYIKLTSSMRDKYHEIIQEIFT